MPTLAPRLLVIAALALFVALVTPAAADAARPCWKDLVDDYWADNRVDKIYPISCYRDAMQHLPRDVQEYSDAHDDLRRALLAAIRDQRTNGGFEQPDEEDEASAAAPAGDDDGGGGFFREVLDKLGPKNADSVPVPLLVLASIAILLLGAAGVSYAARWIQSRRMPIATTPAPHEDPRG